MSFTGDELSLNDQAYLMKLNDGKYFYVGKLMDRRKSYDKILEHYSYTNNIFIFEHNPPADNSKKMFLWHYYKLFKPVPSELQKGENNT